MSNTGAWRTAVNPLRVVATHERSRPCAGRAGRRGSRMSSRPVTPAVAKHTAPHGHGSPGLMSNRYPPATPVTTINGLANMNARAKTRSAGRWLPSSRMPSTAQASSAPVASVVPSASTNSATTQSAKPSAYQYMTKATLRIPQLSRKETLRPTTSATAPVGTSNRKAAIR